jgi:hypothetical protein
MNIEVQWREVRPGVWRSEAVDPRTNKKYLGHPVPTSFAVKLGMKASNIIKGGK